MSHALLHLSLCISLLLELRLSDGSLIDALIDAITNTIVPSRKFAVLERTENQAIQREYLIASSGSAAIEESVRLQSTLAADFLLIINITDIKKNTANGGDRIVLKANIKLLDYSTGQVRYSLSRMVPGSLVANQTEKLVAQRLGRLLANEMMEYGFPSTVVGIDGKYLTVDAGNSKFQKGDNVGIFLIGSDFEDPNTGESLGGSQREIAKGVIETTAERVSVVIATSGLSDLGNLLKASTGGKLPKLIVRFEEGASSSLDKTSSPDSTFGYDKRKNNDW